MKKTLIITLEYPPQTGGIASYVYNFVTHINDKGNAFVYAPSAAFTPNEDHIYRRKPYWNFFWPRWTRMLVQVFRIARKQKIEQLFIHHVLPVGYVGLILKKLLKIRYFIFLHGTDVQLAGRNIFKRCLFSMVCRNADKVVVNSEFLRKKLLSIAGFSLPIVILYPAAADFFLNDFGSDKNAELKNSLALNGKKVILSVARMSAGKGYAHLAKIMPEIVRQIPNLVWLIIGSGTKEKELHQMIQKFGLQNVARPLGDVEYKNLPKFYRLANVFVLLTHPEKNAEEGWGTVFAEAGASGVPAVAGRCGGVAEAVEDNVTGYLVDADNEESAIEAIVKLLRNPELAKQMGEAGRKRAFSELNWAGQIQSFEAAAGI